ncbi:MAG: hypothetical protein R3B46_10900 [Phycisphaerales bacterium]
MNTPSKALTRTAPLLVIATAVLAGDLNPPPGIVTPTMKSLSEVEPRTAISADNTPGDADALFKITEPGSYYLKGNITGVIGKHGIEIASSGVTLDLNGFDLVGVPGMGLFDGVNVTLDNLVNIAVINGSIRDWGDEGIDLNFTSARNCRVERVRVSGNTTGNGIRLGAGSAVIDCSVYNNSIGILTNAGCTILNCTVSSNSGSGISTGTTATIANCSVYLSGGGRIGTSSGASIANCAPSATPDSASAPGVGSTISACTASGNGSSGISISSGTPSSMAATRAQRRRQHRRQLRMPHQSNTCNSNGSPGDGAGHPHHQHRQPHRGNNCTGADRGIDIDSTGNIVIRNTCSGNSVSWDIVAGNALAPIVFAANNAANVVGSTYAGSLRSSDPNANFTY